MVIHMKTTLQIDDRVFVQLKRYAAAHGRTMSDVVETALRRLLQSRPEPAALPPTAVVRQRGRARGRR